jgi:phosphoribosylaminoimidazolecarboxamide formyltransferase/IMP cyclohydrolase
MVLKRALISVSDKTGAADFATGLSKLGFEIISTGGTGHLLKEAGIQVTEVSDVTGFPEMMDGRVKTLHPRIHGGILAQRDNPTHMEEAEREGIEPIDIVAVNLYPFEATVAKEGVALEEAVEQIDIGGPTLIRASAKNYKHVVIVTDPADYPLVLEELQEDGQVSMETRERLALKAFERTADYDSAIEAYLSKTFGQGERLRLKFRDGKDLRYGENWHQWSRFYTAPEVKEPGMARAVQHSGKEMSFNNYVDADSAMQAVMPLNDRPAVAIIKHNNPCGLATGRTLREALEMAWAGDPVSAFGSVIAFNREVDVDTARFLEGKFIEVLVAPGYSEDALDFFKENKKNLRVIQAEGLGAEEPKEDTTYRFIPGGLLTQKRDLEDYDVMETVTKKPFPEGKKPLAVFALRALKMIKSNAIVIAYEYREGEYMLLGMGSGQPNRLEAIRLAGKKARANLEAMGRDVDRRMAECVLSSEAFFPFADNIHLIAEYGIKHIISVRGSIRDQEVIAAADEYGMAMLFTGMRHFLH